MKDSRHLEVGRRTFVGVTAAAGALLASPFASLAFAEPQATVDRVFALLQPHFGLREADRPVVALLSARLAGKCAPAAGHSPCATPEAFASMVLAREEAERLELYLVEEFIANTNYLAVAAGEESSLRLLEA